MHNYDMRAPQAEKKAASGTVLPSFLPRRSVDNRAGAPAYSHCLCLALIAVPAKSRHVYVDWSMSIIMTVKQLQGEVRKSHQETHRSKHVSNVRSTRLYKLDTHVSYMYRRSTCAAIKLVRLDLQQKLYVAAQLASLICEFESFRIAL